MGANPFIRLFERVTVPSLAFVNFSILHSVTPRHNTLRSVYDCRPLEPLFPFDNAKVRRLLRKAILKMLFNIR